ncbi:MAG: transcription termination/antitermination protein NusG [Metamycoplasmataceae bacterium]
MIDKLKMEWYMVSTVSKKEENVIENLKNKISAEGMNHLFEDFKIFKQPVITSAELLKKSKGKEYKIKMENMYKGYIFVKVVMTDEAWFLIRNTENVTGLVGSSGKGTKPTPISERQIQKSIEMEKLKNQEFKDLEYKNPFEIGVMVQIVQGSFTGEKGKIIETDIENQLAIVEIESFGRKVPTEFSYKALSTITNNN